MKNNQITGSRAVMESLVLEGVKVIFGYPGGAIMPVYDALYDFREKINHILVRHEQGAGHAAQGYARITGKAGVTLVTSGPGATNLVTAITDAMMDSVPMVCIAGQVPAALLGTDAFQEADLMGITTPITKWNYQITKASEVAETFSKAFSIAQTGRPGPVFIEITKNAQTEKCNFIYPERRRVDKEVYQEEKMKKAAELVNKAERPLLLMGHGILISKAEKELQKFVEKSDMPVASTLHGLSGFSPNHRLYKGMLGMHGNYAPNILTNKADIIVAIGMRFDDRVTGRVADYAKQAKIIHIDIDSAEFNKNVKVDLAIHSDAKAALIELTKLTKENKHTEWVKSFDVYDQMEYKIIEPEIYPTEEQITMAEVINLLSDITKGEAVIVADVGQHQMVAARYYKWKHTDSFITSGGLGTMGFSLPAALGAKIAAPHKQVIAIVGDGCFQMNIQELATIAQEKIPVKVIILNNNYLGMVRQWQELFFEKRYSFVDLKNPDFVTICKGFFIQAEKITDRKDLRKSLAKLKASNEAFVLEVIVKKEHNVFPMIAPGASIGEMRLE